MLNERLPVQHGRLFGLHVEDESGCASVESAASSCKHGGRQPRKEALTHKGCGSGVSGCGGCGSVEALATTPGGFEGCCGGGWGGQVICLDQERSDGHDVAGVGAYL